MAQSDRPRITFSVKENPLTAPLIDDPTRTPAERAVERFSVSGNAIVTGGAGYLGIEAARALLEHGALGLAIWDIAAAFENPSSRSAVDALKAEFPKIPIIEQIVDVTNEEVIDNAVQHTTIALGSVDVLLCFAGISAGGSATDVNADLWKKVLEVNTTGSFLCARSVARQMISQNTGGSIVLVASVAGQKVLYPLLASAYSTSKAAVVELAQTLAAEWARYGIRVNSLSPGFIESQMASNELAAPGRRDWEERNPMGRVGVPKEITGPVIMLCSPAGRYITGTDILITGGGHVL